MFFFFFKFFPCSVELSEVDDASGKLFRYSSPEPSQMLQSFAVEESGETGSFNDGEMRITSKLVEN